METNNSFTNRDRFLRTLRYQPMDHPPLILDSIWDTTLRRWYGDGYPADTAPSDYFGVERMLFVNAGLDTGLFPPFPESVLQESDREVVKHDGYGRIARCFKHTMSMPEYLEYPVKTVDDLRRIITERFDLSTLAERWPAKWPENIARRGPCTLYFVDGGCYYDTLRNLAGLEYASRLFYDEPALVHDLFERMHAICQANLHAVQSRITVDYLGFGEDLAFKTSTLISPDLFREFLLPRYKGIVESARRRGITTVWYDSDGNLGPLFDLLFESGIDCFGPMEIAAGMNPVALRNKHGRKLKMTGGIDKRQVARGKAWIDREINSKIPVIREGGYIPYIDHSVSDDISLENSTYYINAMKQLYGIPDGINRTKEKRCSI